MPRNYGRVATSIWRDDDFHHLTADARFTYLMLFTQPNISAAGVLEVTDRRWARSLGFDQERLSTALDELVDAGYVLIDYDTQELLVRSFVKWDGGANNPLRCKAIGESAAVVASPLLRDSIAIELDRISVPHSLSRPYREGVDTRGVVVTDSELIPQPLSATQGGEPEPFDPLDADEPPSEFCPKHPSGTTDPCGACGTAKRINRLWHDREAKRAEDARRTIRRAILDCTDCDSKGYVPVADGMVARCSKHPTRLIEMLPSLPVSVPGVGA